MAALILAKSGHEGCGIFPVATLEEVIKYFQGQGVLENALKNGIKFDNLIPKAIDLGRIRGQQKAKDAACIAAAGGHNLLLIGPPGEGKSLLASAIPGILPRLTDPEKVELTRIYSAYGAASKMVWRLRGARCARPSLSIATIDHRRGKPNPPPGGDHSRAPGSPFPRRDR